MQSQIDPFKGNLQAEYEEITPDKCSKWGKERLLLHTSVGQVGLHSQVHLHKDNLLPEYEQITPNKCSKWGKEAKK